MKLQIPDKFSGLLGKINEKNFHYIFTGALILIFLLYYFVLIRPQINAIWKIKPEIESLSENIKKTKSDVTNLQDYKNKVEDFEQKLALMQAKVKLKYEMPLILERVSRIANEKNIKIDQITPLSVDAVSLLEDKHRKYYSLPIEIDASSGYHDFGGFLNALEQDEIFFKITEFSIAARSSSRTHRINLTLNTIIYEEVGTE